MVINQNNTKYTILILDDQPEVIADISKMINKMFPAIDIVSFTSFEDFSAEKNKIIYNVVLADVFLGDAISIEKFNVITKNNTIPLIYMSGNPQSTFDVYETPHIYFLAKPIEELMLKKAIEKAINNNTYITVTFWKKEVKISTEEIMYIESNKRIISVVTVDNVYETYAKLDQLSSQLPTPFVRVSKSYFVNKNYIVERSSDCVVMKNGARIPISRSKRGVAI